MLATAFKKLIIGKNRKQKEPVYNAQIAKNKKLENIKIINCTPFKTENIIENLNETQNQSDDSVYNISVGQYEFNHKLAEILVSINGHKIVALLDLGATKTVIKIYYPPRRR